MENIRYRIWIIEFVCITAIGVIPSIDTISIYWLALPIFIILGVKLYEYTLIERERHAKVPVQLRLLHNLMNFETDSGVRFTYHVLLSKNKYVQFCDYIPTGTGGGRVFSRSKGLVSYSLKWKKTFAENFTSQDEFSRKMVEKYNFTRDEVGERWLDRRSFFCFPLLDEFHEVQGLLYFDSSKSGCFTLSETDQKMSTILKACESIQNSIL